jgi:hypothetical protein
VKPLSGLGVIINIYQNEILTPHFYIFRCISALPTGLGEEQNEQ